MVAKTHDVAVVGAGVFGCWVTYQLQVQGAQVVLIDSYGPANSRASSGGESRIMRLGYGPDEIYTRSAQRSLKIWQTFFDRIEFVDRTADPLFHQTGVLWFAREHDPYADATIATLRRCGVAVEQLDRTELERRYPQLAFGPVAWGILEPGSGVLMSRQAVRAVVRHVLSLGATYRQETILPPDPKGKLQSVTTSGGEKIHAEKFVFACGPWLPKIFPEILKELIHVTRQEVFFFGVPPGERRFTPPHLPVWIDFSDLIYSIPDVDGRGFKLAIDAHGPIFDPDCGERAVTEAGLKTARSYISERVPALSNAPMLEARVCQYENTSNGDFLIDSHPDFKNLWLVGGGSGHGFKHGPAVGEYVARMTLGIADIEPRFTLASKGRIHDRQVY